MDPALRVPLEERLVFWKIDARTHIVEDPHRPIDIYAYPQGYAYRIGVDIGQSECDPNRSP